MVDMFLPHPDPSETPNRSADGASHPDVMI